MPPEARIEHLCVALPTQVHRECPDEESQLVQQARVVRLDEGLGEVDQLGDFLEALSPVFNLVRRAILRQEVVRVGYSLSRVHDMIERIAQQERPRLDREPKKTQRLVHGEIVAGPRGGKLVGDTFPKIQNHIRRADRNGLEKEPFAKRHREGNSRHPHGGQADQFHTLVQIVVILSVPLGVLIQLHEKELERGVNQHEASDGRLATDDGLEGLQKIERGQERPIPLDEPLKPLGRARGGRGEYRARRRDLPQCVGELQTELRQRRGVRTVGGWRAGAHRPPSPAWPAP